MYENETGPIPSAHLHGGIASCHAAVRREGWLAPYLINKWESDSSTGYPDRFNIKFLKGLGLASKLQRGYVYLPLIQASPLLVNSINMRLLSVINECAIPFIFISGPCH